MRPRAPRFSFKKLNASAAVLNLLFSSLRRAKACAARRAPDTHPRLGTSSARAPRRGRRRRGAACRIAPDDIARRRAGLQYKYRGLSNLGTCSVITCVKLWIEAVF